MKICISGSMTLFNKMEKLSEKLNSLGHQTLLPSVGAEPHLIERLAHADTTERKAIFVEDHLEKIRKSDAVVVANFEKDGVFGYVGSSALMEAAMAYALGKQLFVLNEPAVAEIKDDLFSLGAIELSGDHTLIPFAVT